MTVGNRECHYPRSELKERQLRGITVHRNSRPALAGLFTKVQVRLCSRWSVQCTYFRTSIIGYWRLHDTRKNKNSRQTDGRQCVCHRCSHPFAPHSFDQSERRILKSIGSMLLPADQTKCGAPWCHGTESQRPVEDVGL